MVFRDGEIGLVETPLLRTSVKDFRGEEDFSDEAAIGLV